VGDIPHADGTDRGWADRFATALAAGSPGLEYANLAIRGRKIGEVLEEQLEPALALEPDLVSVMAGANDLIRPRVDLGLILATMDRMQAAFADTGATILTNTYPVAEGSGPFGRGVSERFRAYNRGLRRVAAENGALLLDLEPIPAAADPRLWAPDRLHLNAEGHARLAAGMLSLVGAGEPRWDLELPPVPRSSPASKLAGELEWTVRYLVPWIGRRLTGRSSGDGRSAKRPQPGVPPT
jgi:lysophospholipase L1-like esterase